MVTRNDTPYTGMVVPGRPISYDSHGSRQNGDTNVCWCEETVCSELGSYSTVGTVRVRRGAWTLAAGPA